MIVVGSLLTPQIALNGWYITLMHQMVGSILGLPHETKNNGGVNEEEIGSCRTELD